MDLVWLVYGISLLHGFGGILLTATIISTIALIFLLVYRGMECSQESFYGEKENELRKEKAEWANGHIKSTFIVFIVSLTLQTFLPNEKTAYLMVGAYATQKIAENEKVQETGSKVLTIINQKLDEYVDEGIKDATEKAERAARKSK